MNKKITTTYDRFVNKMSAREKRAFDQEYNELLLSELLIALMQQNEISIRKLAEAANISPTIIQGIRAGKRKNLTLQSFLNILEALGYSLVIEKPTKQGIAKDRIILHNLFDDSRVHK